MANQPKKYQKFVATAATATLVATAVVPAASADSKFSDIGTYAQEVQDEVVFLADLGVINGFEDGTFKPSQNITRGQAVKMIGRFLEEQGIVEVPANWETEQSFDDIALNRSDRDLVKYAAVVKAAGVFQGNGNVLNPSGFTTRENMALILDRLIGQVSGKTAVQWAEGKENNVSDLANAKEEAQAAIAALNALGVSNSEEFKPKNNTQRVHFASFLARVINLVDVTPAPADAKIKEAKAINAKTIEVTFEAPVEDTTKAAIEVLRGTAKQNVTVEWSADKTSVQLVAATNFQPADYTVNITGLSEEALTATVKIEAQKIASIEILDEVAVVNTTAAADGTLPAGTSATVGYIVKDQYGTDITKSTDLTTNSGAITLDKSKGIVKIDNLDGKKLGDLVAVVLVDSKTGVTTNKVVKLSAEPTVSSIAVAGLFNAKGEAITLNDASDASDAYIVLDLKDQYGKEITDVKRAEGLLITNTRKDIIEIADAVEAQEIGEDDKLVIPVTEVLKAGAAEILLISTTNGQTARYTVNVAETATTDGITVAQPEIAVAGETTLVPVTVTDKDGNVITDKKLLANADKGIKVGGTTVSTSQLEVKDGQVYYKATFTEGTQALVFQSATNKVATVTIAVKAAAKPAVVRGFKKPLVLVAGTPVTIETAKHLVIEDQYGRVIKDSDAAVSITLDKTDSKVLKLEGNQVTGLANGTETLTIKLAEEFTPANATTPVDSAVDVKVQVTDGKEYTSYNAPTTALLNAAAENEVTVNGVLSNGGEVALTPAEYVAKTDSEFVTVTEGKLVVDAEKFFVDAEGKKVTEKEVKVTYTINADGKTVEQTYKLSTKTPAATDFFFTTAAAESKYADAKAITEAVLNSGVGVTTGLFDKAEEGLIVNVATVDQYENEAIQKLDAASTITVVPAKASEVTISGNATSNPTVTLAADVKEAKATLKVKVGNTTKELPVTIVKEVTPSTPETTPAPTLTGAPSLKVDATIALKDIVESVNEVDNEALVELKKPASMTDAEYAATTFSLTIGEVTAESEGEGRKLFALTGVTKAEVEAVLETAEATYAGAERISTDLANKNFAVKLAKTDSLKDLANEVTNTLAIDQDAEVTFKSAGKVVGDFSVKKGEDLAAAILTRLPEAVTAETLIAGKTYTVELKNADGQTSVYTVNFNEL